MLLFSIKSHQKRATFALTMTPHTKRNIFPPSPVHGFVFRCLYIFGWVSWWLLLADSLSSAAPATLKKPTQNIRESYIIVLVMIFFLVKKKRFFSCCSKKKKKSKNSAYFCSKKIWRFSVIWLFVLGVYVSLVCYLFPLFFVFYFCFYISYAIFKQSMSKIHDTDTLLKKTIATTWIMFTVALTAR